MARLRRDIAHRLCPVHDRTPVARLGAGLAMGLMLISAPAVAQTGAQGAPGQPAREAVAPQPCADCRGEAIPGRPAPSSTVTVTPDGRTIVPRPLMREQADFRLGEALRSVPGINRR